MTSERRFRKPQLSRFGGVLAAGRAAVVVLCFTLAVRVGEPALGTDAARAAPSCDLLVAIPEKKKVNVG